MTYLTIGTNYISSELFQEIKNTNTPKPYGGIWATKQNPIYHSYNEWMDYLCQNPHIIYYKNYDNPYSLDAVLITLKEDAKIYTIENINDLNNLKKNYPHNGWINYELLANYYDGIYIDLKSIKNEVNSDDFQKLKTFSVNTLILFNLQCIKYYQQANINISYNTISEYYININDKKEYINTPSIDILILIEIIKRYIKNNNLIPNKENYELIRKIFNKTIKETLRYDNTPKKELLLIKKAFNQF